MQKLLPYYYPEVSAGGFSRDDAQVAFYSRINALLAPTARVLDFGAGRGRYQQDDKVEWRRKLRILRGKCAEVVGCDVSPAVLENPSLDRAVVIDPTKPLPFADNEFDLILSDMVFEHVNDVTHVARELDRVLKPGGWICARTPNRFGYIAMAASLVPNRFHAAVLKIAQPGGRAERDIFPTVYRMNTRRALRRLFPLQDYDDYSYVTNSHPAYAGNIRVAWYLTWLWFRLTPEALASMRMIFLRKKETPMAAQPAGRIQAG